MGKDEHEKRRKHQPKRREVLGEMADEVLSREPTNGHKKVIDDLANGVAESSDIGHNLSTGANAPQNRGRRNMNDAVETAEVKGKKSKNINYTYRNLDGQVTDKFTTEVRAVIYTLAQYPDKSTEFDCFKLWNAEQIAAIEATGMSFDEYLRHLSPMARMSMAMGGKTTVGNAMTAAKDTDSSDELLEYLTDRVSTIYDGEWREGGQRGPRTADVLEAMKRRFKEVTGKEPSEAKVAAFKATIDEHGVKGVLTDRDVNAHLEAIKLEKQQEKLNKARAEAGKQPSALAALFAE